jgi:prepilin-type N-terminal cleavage/methylation domain-containing protein
MNRQQLKKKSEGFTIIEVLIVLAIAGLIMLIVFLAVPALQRNSRNNARNSEAARVSAAATDCLANRNGVVASCTTAVITAGTGTLQQLETVTVGTTPAYTQNNAYVAFGRECDNTGTTSNASASSRKFTVTYQLEPNVNRCIGSE